MWLLVALLACGDVAPSEPSAAVPRFWEHWGDGRAEIARYELAFPRYGESRRGVATLVFVTEDFTRGPRVKSDGGHGDEYPVLKLNDVRDFQTGIYDYNVMTSTFVPLDGSLSRGLPTKVSLSVQEWCGHVWDQLLVDPRAIRRTGHSYFDGEADREDRLTVPDAGVVGDALPILVRGVVGDLVAPGASREVPYLPTLLETRLAHVDLGWTTATIARGASPEEVVVPAGSFLAERFTLTAAETTEWWVEVAPPRRIVRWSRSTGEEASLTGSIRTAYWEQNGEGDEAALIGLVPPDAAPAP